MFKISELIKVTSGRLVHRLRTKSVRGVSIDSRSIKKGELFIAIKGNNFDGHDFIAQAIKKGASCIIYQSGLRTKDLRPSKKVTYIKVSDTVKALGDIAKFHRRKFNIPVIAITGSNGKTTAKEMLAWVLAKKFKVLKNEGTQNNHIGVPLTLLGLHPAHDLAVLELGTNHFGEIAYLAKICQPNIGIITNIAESHLENFGGLEGVLQEKYSLARYLEKPRILIINSDDVLLAKKTSGLKNRPWVLGFALKEETDFHASGLQGAAGKIKFSVNKDNRFILRTAAGHNIYNALAVIAAGRILGLSYADIALRLLKFNFPKGRMQLLRFKNIQLFDDTYNSNPSSLRQALDTLANYRTPGRRILVMGDMLELGSAEEEFHRQAGRHAAQICDILVTVGKLAKNAAQAARESGIAAQNIFTCNSALDAGEVLAHRVLILPQDIILVKGSRAMRMEDAFKSLNDK